VIRARGLGKRFGARVAVADLDLDAAAGEIVGLLGPNGAGKTTTVRMLAGLIAPSSGGAEVCGLRVGPESDAIRGRVGILTETPGLYDHLDPVDNLAFFAELYDVPSGQVGRRIGDLLERFALAERAHDPVGSFSKGMRQKVALARALLHEPEVLFLDEPTSGLDPEAARSVRELILEQAAAGRTVLLCTHNLDEAARLCRRVCVIRGRLLGTTELEPMPPTVIRIVGDPRALVEPATRVGGVTSAWVEKQDLLVRVTEQATVVPALVTALVGAGARIVEVTHAPRQLDELYFRLLGDVEPA
jgi:ABC-2 type transport system ATP-binding protein